MHKILLPLIFFLSVQTLYAVEKKSKIEVTAKQIDSNGTTVRATDGVVVFYENSTIKATSASYDKETKLLVLDGNVEMIGYKGSKEHMKHLEIQTQSNEVTFEELFFVSENDVWLFTDKATRNEGNYTFGRSMLSSCDIDDPLWKMVFANSIYDSKAGYMKVYDAKVYFWDVPIFYSPYLSFSTNKKRSSGLLSPRLGYTEKEGYVYEQPIFWAISPSMDLELNPQIRTNRSVGLYSTFRFLNNEHSYGKLRVGYFKDKESYMVENNLPEQEHYGVEFSYESSEMFSGKPSQEFTDGLYVNATFLNDIDYINLQKTRFQSFGLTPIQESRFNYFLANENYYAGINTKYFIDTRKENDDETLQVLPSVQLHKYLDHFLWKNLTYSTDIQFKNLDRKKGTTLKQVEMKIPIEFTASFFNDFVNISFSEEIYYSKFFFGSGNYIYDDFQYYNNTHRVKLFTDLTKKYDNFIHVLSTSLEYVKLGNEDENPVAFDMLLDEQKELFSVGLSEEHYSFSLSHYFYDTEMNLGLYQRISQKYYTNREYEFADISNEMMYDSGKLVLYNNLVYAPEFDKIRESSSYISLNQEFYNFSVGHAYKQVLDDQPNTIAANDLNLNVGYAFNERLKFSAGVTYNVDDSSSRQWIFGGAYERDCWSMSAYVRQDITPRPTGYTTDNSIYLQFNFIPFGGIGISSAQLDQPVQ